MTLGEGDGECPDAGEMPTESPEFEKTRRLAEKARGDRCLSLFFFFLFFSTTN